VTTAKSRSTDRRLAGRAPAVLLKLGGELLEDAGRVEALSAAIARLSEATPLVVVHGGGREIDGALARAGIEKRQVDGLRITDDATLEVVVSVLAGLINTRLVAALTAAGASAIGLTGVDAGLGIVEPAARHVSASGLSVDLGRVGDPVGTGRPRLLDDLCARGYVPVVASIGVGRDGRLFNVNADTLAAHLAGRLRSPRLIIAGSTAGVLNATGDTIPALGLRELDALVASGGATAGMVAKLTACRKAIRGGVREVFVADGYALDELAAVVRRGSRAGASRATRIAADPATSGRRRQRQGVPVRDANLRGVHVP
jgi:acetylglutamate kinase